MEATCFSEASVDFQRATRLYITEDMALRIVTVYEKEVLGRINGKYE
jgi:hypothetical protein